MACWISHQGSDLYPCIENMESYPLDHQESPHMVFL